MDKEDIKKILPHREPMLLLDEVHLNEKGEAEGKYHINGEEWFLQGHYPDRPIVPGAIQCEILAQTCCLLFKDELENKIPLFAGMDKVKFKSSVLPGDTLQAVCRLDSVKGSFYFASGKGYVNGRLCVSGEFFFTLIPKSKE